MIYAISDLHGNLPDPPADADALLIAGDICPDFRTSFRWERGKVYESSDGSEQQANWLNDELRAWLNAHSIPTVAIWGNHDYIGEHPALIPDLPWSLLQDSGVKLKLDGSSVNVYGTPWVPRLPAWAFYASDEALAARAEVIPRGLDVLMTHGPPLRVGDYVPGGTPAQVSKYGNREGMHVGDSTLNRAISRALPSVTICGHIHEGRGRHWCHGLPVYNCAAVDAKYNLHPKPWTRLPL